ncbi:MAG: anthranilate synthase component I family protein [Nitrososphaerales archaeon]|jgi:anthranilate synthase component 1
MLEFSVKEIHLQNPALASFANLRESHDYTCILESATGAERLAELSIIVFDPFCILTASHGQVRIEDRRNNTTSKLESKDPLLAIRKIIRFTPVKNKHFRFLGGAVGYIGFDAVGYWEQKLAEMKGKTVFPDMQFCFYEEGVIFDHQKYKQFYFHSDRTRDRQNDVEQLSKKPYTMGDFSISKVKTNIKRKKFEDSVKKAKHHILEGDIFQVVLSKRFDFDFKGDLLRFYSELRKLNPSPYMYFLDFGKTNIVGSSPEMLVRVENGVVETFPIAGTRPRTNNKLQNKRFKEELLADPKERAEHIMLVDLARNDVGRVSQFGTVSVPEFMVVKEFSHVQHIVSQVTGKLATGLDCFDAMRSIFPAGTVSGAPKIRAMEIIEELETGRRGPYAGAVGYFSFNGNMDSAITIRTLVTRENKASIQAGAGIVADSDPKAEWFETEHKARALFNAIENASKKESTV